MQFGSGDDEDGLLSAINTTPLVDVMLVLLIMLIVTIPLRTDATRLALAAGTPVAETLPPAALAAGLDGALLWDGMPVADAAALDDLLRAVAARPPQGVRLRPDGRAAYRHVLAVLAAAQRDGVTRIGVVGNEQFTE